MQKQELPKQVSATADYIREAREQKGLTLQQAAEATRIPRYYLEILEGGGDQRLVSDRLYMVHFLRGYAAFLEVEQETLAAQFLRENRQTEPEAIVPVPRRRSRKAVVMAVLAVLLLIGAGVYLYDPALVQLGGLTAGRVAVQPAPAPTPPETPAQAPPPISSAPARTGEPGSSVLQPEANETDPSTPRLVATPPPAETVPAPTPEPGPGPVATERAAPAETVEPSSPPGESVAVSTTPQDVSVPTTTEAAPAADAGQEPPAPGPQQQQTAVTGTQATDEPGTPGTADAPPAHSLTILAEQRSWLRVWVDGEPFQDMLLSPGEARTLSAQTHFVITFGNAGGVRLTLNGEELPPVGTPGQVVRGRKFPADE